MLEVADLMQRSAGRGGRHDTLDAVQAGRAALDGAVLSPWREISGAGGYAGFLTGDQGSVGMGLFFYPRGGSARVAGYLSRALQAFGWPVTLTCGSLGPVGALGNAESVFAGVDIVPARL